MKKETKIILIAIIIVVFTLLVSYIWFLYFSKDKEKALANLEVALKDNGQGVNIEGLSPTSDKEAKKIKAYNFKVENKGNIKSRYQILLEETSIKNEDTYRQKELLSRNTLRYQLILNDIVIKVDDMNNIKGNIIDERTIEKNHVNEYKLRIWIKENLDEEEWLGKYYHYKINIKSINKEGF